MPKKTYSVPPPNPTFTIAITGHRDLGDATNQQRVNNAMAQLIARLRDRISNTAPRSTVRGLSALAVGADQTFARALLASSKFTQDTLTCELHAVLPVDQAIYADALAAGITPSTETPQGDTAQQSFEQLLKQANRIFELADFDQWAPEQTSAPNTAQYWTQRRLQTLGNILVTQADLVVAVWRGGPPAGAGGTADVVRMALMQGVPIIVLHPNDHTIRVLMPDLATTDPLRRFTNTTPAPSDQWTPDKALREHITGLLAGPEASASELKDPSSLAFFCGKTGQPNSSEPGETASDKTYWWTYSRFMTLFMKPFSLLSTNSLSTWAVTTDHIARDWQEEKQADGHTADSDQVLRETLESADAIATKLSHVYRSSYVMTFLGAVLAAWLGLVGLFSKNYKWVFVSAELALLLALIVFYLVSRKRAWHSRWLNARYLTERVRGARCLAWLGLAGRRTNPPARSWSSWLANAVITQTGLPRVKMDRDQMAALIPMIRDQVAAQHKYHEKNHAKLTTLHWRLDVVGWLCLIIALLAAALYVLIVDPMDCYGASWCTDTFITLSRYTVTSVCAGMPILAAALSGIRYQGDFERFAERSEETAHALNDVLLRLEQFERRLQNHDQNAKHNVPYYEDLADIVHATADIYHADLSDWRFVYAARPNPGIG